MIYASDGVCLPDRWERGPMPNFFKHVFAKFEPLRREDPIFGSMLYMGDKLRYWEAKARFPVQNGQVEVFVDGGKGDSLERQHLFFRTVCEEWPLLRESFRDKVVQTYAEATGKSLSRPFWEDFKLDSMTVPDAALDTADGTISLSAQSGEDHSYWIEMIVRTA